MKQYRNQVEDRLETCLLLVNGGTGARKHFQEKARSAWSGFCTCLYLGVDNGGITAECSGECWVGKAMAEEVTASPLPLRAEVELTPGSR